MNIVSLYYFPFDSYLFSCTYVCYKINHVYSKNQSLPYSFVFCIPILIIHIHLSVVQTRQGVTNCHQILYTLYLKSYLKSLRIIHTKIHGESSGFNFICFWKKDQWSPTPKNWGVWISKYIWLHYKYLYIAMESIWIQNYNACIHVYIVFMKWLMNLAIAICSFMSNHLPKLLTLSSPF